MYVVTFYSFKGGVGRTLAMVNVAAHLVQTGRTVLAVDFDLEAPGLDSFSSIRADPSVPGIVEFVSEYLETNRSPSVRSFVTECSLGAGHVGHLFLMRSGLRNKSYSARLSAIDWQRLYRERDGYLLFEDLKAQWQQEFRPDYVLIDSRTGHTDVGGICTRQLPNAVVVCFLPNEENISGLETVVSDIRAEAEMPTRKDIRMYFVPSNVPNLDDEQRILSRRIREARQRLGFTAPACIVHRYDSLSLLDSAIFVEERRRSRLAREYRELASTITQDNLEDRDAVLQTLRSGRFIALSGQSKRSIQVMLDDVRVRHASDGEVLHEVAKFFRRLGREEDAQALVRESEALGFRSAQTLLDTAFASAVEQPARALRLMHEALELPDADYFDISRAIQLCVKADPRALATVVESSSFQGLSRDEKRSLCDELLVNRQAAETAERVLRRLGEGRVGLDSAGRTSLMLACIAQGKFKPAMRVLGEARPQPTMLPLPDVFNYAMAEWGATHTPPLDFFGAVLQQVPPEGAIPGRNVCQALAIAGWAIGDRQAATKFWQRAVDISKSDPAASFSAWRYLQVSGDEFRSDLRDLKRMIDGHDVVPAVLAENWARHE